MGITREPPGRPRRYDMTAVPEIPDPAVGYAAAVLGEAVERCADMIRGLPREALEYPEDPDVPSIARFAIHMAWAEAVWMAKVGRCDIPADIAALVAPGNLGTLQGKDGTPLPADLDAGSLIALCRKVREELTIPILASVRGLDEPVDGSPGPGTVGEVIMHVVWSWTYHTGQVGLLRLQYGSDYTWAFHKSGGP